MKRVFFSLTLVSSAGFVCGQDLNVLSAGGTYTEDTGGSVSWTIGEPVILTAESATTHVTQGFQQGNIYVTGVKELDLIQVSIFPNPASETVTIQAPSDMVLRVYDASGRLVAVQDLKEDLNQLNVTGFARGTYNLVFESSNTQKTAQLVVM